MDIEWSSPGRESVTLNLTLEGDSITGVKMKVIGGLSFLRFSQEMKSRLQGPLQSLAAPEGTGTQEMIWRELFSRIQGRWKLPVENEELCHCRKVLTASVDEAIVYGAHDIVNIRKQTSANTGCATCLPDIDALLDYRQ